MKLETSTKMKGEDFEKVKIEEGIYLAELKEVKDIGDGQFGARVALIYKVIDKNVELAHVCYKNKATPSNKLGKALIAHGIELSDGEVDTSGIIGTKVRAWVDDYKVMKDGRETGEVASTISKVKPITEKPNQEE